jgi:cyclohexyl-isocyanide hydratase
MQINIIVVNDMCQLDTTGTFEVLARVPGWTVDLVAASMDPVRTDLGLTLLPTKTRESAKRSDILVVPGGRGVDYAMLDDVWIAYTRQEASQAKYVFSVCTGSLLLAAAGLLKGRRAGAHWQSRDLLSQFGVTPSDARLTVDGKFYTSAGVTSGIDMALLVVADIVGEETARKIRSPSNMLLSRRFQVVRLSPRRQKSSKPSLTGRGAGALIAKASFLLVCTVECHRRPKLDHWGCD